MAGGGGRLWDEAVPSETRGRPLPGPPAPPLSAAAPAPAAGKRGGEMGPPGRHLPDACSHAGGDAAAAYGGKLRLGARAATRGDGRANPPLPAPRRVSEHMDLGPAELVGRSCYQFVHGQDAARIRQSHLDREDPPCSPRPCSGGGQSLQLPTPELSSAQRGGAAGSPSGRARGWLRA